MTHEQRAAAVAKMHALKGADECALVLHGLRTSRKPTENSAVLDDWERLLSNVVGRTP